MLKESIVLLMGCAIAAIMIGPASAADCGKGQSEAVLVTKSGSITMCVDDGIAESKQGGLTVALETVQCPCADFVPREREWSHYKDEQSCDVNGDALVLSAIKSGKGKNGGSEELMFITDSGSCVYQHYYDGLVHRNSYVMLDTTAEIEACQVFGRDLYAAFAGSKREPASCPQ